MARKAKEPESAGKRPKAKISRYIDADLWERVQAFARRQDPVVTDSAVIEAALRHYLDQRDK